jgi:hypothetical protein
MPQDRFRFAGPCDRNDVPYKHPAILKVMNGDVEQTHIVIQFKRLPTTRRLYFFSEQDEYDTANWVGTHEELCAMIDGNTLTFGDMRIQMTPRMTRILTQEWTE